MRGFFKFAAGLCDRAHCHTFDERARHSEFDRTPSDADWNSGALSGPREAHAGPICSLDASRLQRRLLKLQRTLSTRWHPPAEEPVCGITGFQCTAAQRHGVVWRLVNAFATGPHSLPASDRIDYENSSSSSSALCIRLRSQPAERPRSEAERLKCKPARLPPDRGSQQRRTFSVVWEAASPNIYA